MTRQDRYRRSGVPLMEVAGGKVPARFTDAVEEFTAGREAAGLVDRSHQGRLWMAGGQRLAYLHRVTAQRFEQLRPGSGVRASVLERRGKIIDVITGHAFEDHVLILTSAALRETVREWLARYIFRDDVRIEDRTEATGQALLLGPRAREVALALAGPAVEGLEPHAWTPVPGRPRTYLLRTVPLGGESFLLVSPGETDALWEEVLERGRDLGLRPVGEEAYQALRVLAGIPEGGAEVDDQASPLELGLDDSVDLQKGCYTGQEVLAKMVTHRSVKRSLVGLELEPGTVAPPGTDLLREGEGERVGRITSALEVPGTGKGVALAVVGREHAQPGTRLLCGSDGAEARVVSLPFPAPL